MKRVLSLFLSLVLTLGILASVPISDVKFNINVQAANSGSCGKNLTWAFDNGGLTISGTGDMYDYDDFNSVFTPWKDICSDIINIVIANGVTGIGKEAFLDCLYLESVVIPESVTCIKDFAFYNCQSLKEIVLPDNMVSIGYKTFFNTGYYNNIDNWENGFLYIDDYFIEASNHKSTAYKIKSGTKIIADLAFYNFEELTSITIPDSVKRIGYGAFYGCENLISVIVGDGVAYIDDYAFSNCKNLKYIFYKGSQKQWSKISVGSSNAELNKAKIHYETNKHIASSWIIDKKATVNNGGSKHQECIFCGKTLKTAKIVQQKCATPKLKSASNTSTGVKITWNKVSGADSYTVYRKTGKNSWTPIKGSIKGTSYVDKKAKKGVTYKYTVKAKNEVGFSGYNTTGLSIRRLVTPAKISVSNVKTGINIKWDKATGATGYYVMRKTGNGNWKKLATVKGTTYTDKNVKTGYNYKYTVKAYYGKSISVCDSKGVAVKRLVAPTLKSAKSTKAGVTIKWNKVKGAEGYVIYRQAGFSQYIKVGTVKGESKVSYTDKKAIEVIKYNYKIKAYFNNSYSLYSNAKTILHCTVKSPEYGTVLTVNPSKSGLKYDDWLWGAVSKTYIWETDEAGGYWGVYSTTSLSVSEIDQWGVYGFPACDTLAPTHKGKRGEKYEFVVWVWLGH